MLVPFSCFHLVKENVYPAALLLIRGHCPTGAGETETEGERLLCSMRGIHTVLNRDIVTTGYCFSKYCMFSYSRHLPPTGHSVTQISCFFPTGTFLKTSFSFSKHLDDSHTFSIDPKISLLQKLALFPLQYIFFSSKHIPATLISWFCNMIKMKVNSFPFCVLFTKKLPPIGCIPLPHTSCVTMTAKRQGLLQVSPHLSSILDRRVTQ